MPNRDQYLKDKRFISDARAFLFDRTGDLYTDPEEVVDNFLEQRRVATVNEVSMLRDLEYAQEADDNGKQRFARLLDDFDAYDGGLGLSGVGDYAQGLISSPLTLGSAAVSFGAGAIAKTGAQLAGRQAAMAGLRKLLVPSTLGGAVRGAALGAAEGAATEEIYQRTREETGAGREEGMVGVVGAVGGVLGGGLGAMAGKAGSKLAAKAGETLKVADEARAAMAATQKEAVDKVRALAEGGKAAQRKAKKEGLRALDKEWVAAGDELLDSLNDNTALAARLPKETIEAVSIAAAEMASTITKKPGQRITETIAEGISSGKISADAFNEILDTYKITREQFSAVYMADVSNAAKLMQKQSALRKSVGAASGEDPLKVFLTKMKGAVNEKYLDITAEEMSEVVEKPHQIASFLKGMDRLRLGMMTSQLATTVRNTAGGGFRLAVDAFESGIDSIAKKVTGKSSNVSVLLDSSAATKFMVRQDEAAIVQMLFEETMPTKARRLFFSAADAEAKLTRDTLTGTKTTAVEGLLGSIGHKVNFLNTVSDNVFKRAMFSASLDRQIRASGGKGLMDVVKQGKFGEIDESFIKTAMDDALEFTYQKMPDKSKWTGEVGDALIRAHRSAPFLISSFIPFPRFLINQLKFVHEHSVVMPLLTSALGATKMPEKYFAKSMTGMMMLSAAYQFRVTQPEDSKWNQYVDKQGNVKDMSPMLGPFAPYMIAAEFIKKHYEGNDSATMTKYVQDTAKALGTPRMAPSSGWATIDKFTQDLVDGKALRAWGRLSGDVIGTYTMPVAMVRDIAASMDPDYRGVREMDQVLPSEGNAMVDWWNYTKHYAQRNFITEVGTEDGAPVMYSPTAEGPLKRTRAIEKQLTGVATYAPKTVLQRELDILGMDRRDIMSFESDPLKAQTLEALMGGGVEGVDSLSSVMSTYIYSDDYQSLPREEKRFALSRKLDEVIGEKGYKDIATDLLTEDYATDKPMEYSQNARIKFEKLPMEVRKKLEREWLKSDEYIQQLINNPDMAVDMSIYEAGAYDWAIEVSKSIK